MTPELPADVVEALDRWRREGPHYIGDPEVDSLVLRLVSAALAGENLRKLLLREATEVQRLRNLLEQKTRELGKAHIELAALCGPTDDESPESCGGLSEVDPPEILRGPYPLPERR